MLTGRWYGGSWARSSPSIRILPEVAVSSPASMRSKVDLPQPELPSRANSSPLPTDRLTWRTAVVSPNFLTTSTIRTKFAAWSACAAGDGAPADGMRDWLFMICCITPACYQTKAIEDEQSPRGYQGLDGAGSIPGRGRQRPDLNSVHSRVCRRWISGGSGLSRNSVFTTSAGG